uniref:Uncharacterized protein n=1 Tax=Triticum urartu TaxID=4572 RepID=A0A8R7QDL6_TRIUA
MGVRQTGVSLDGDLISRRLIHIDLDQRHVLDLHPGDLLDLALLHKSGHLGVVGDGLLDLLEGVLALLLLKHPHEPASGLYPISSMSPIGKRPFGRPSSSRSSTDFLQTSPPLMTSAPARWLSTSWDAIGANWFA